MSDTAGWTEQISCGQVDEKSSTVSRAALLSVLILLLAIGASAWIYCNETRALARLASPLGAEVNLGSLRPNTALLDQFDHWVFWVIVATVGGCTGCLLVTAGCLLLKRRAWGK